MYVNLNHFWNSIECMLCRLLKSCVQVSLEWVSVEVDQFGTNQQTHIIVLEIKWHWYSPSNSITTRGAQNSSRPTPASFHYVIMKSCSIGSPLPGSSAMGLESRVGIILGWFDNVDQHATLTPWHMNSTVSPS